MNDLQLIQMSEADEPFVRRLEIRDEQKDFVRPIASLLDNRDPRDNCYIVKRDNDIVGFFKIIKAAPGEYEGYCNGSELILRSFFIDKNYQGQGLGMAACLLLHKILISNFTNSKLVLTVNLKNYPAQYVYLKSGFSIANHIYKGGSKGWQYTFYMHLSSSAHSSDLDEA